MPCPVCGESHKAHRWNFGLKWKKFFTNLSLQAFFSWPRQRESLRDSGLPAWWIQQMWQITPVLDESFIWKCQDCGVFTNWHPGPWGISGLCLHSDIGSSPSVSETIFAPLPFYHLLSLICSFMSFDWVFCQFWMCDDWKITSQLLPKSTFTFICPNKIDSRLWSAAVMWVEDTGDYRTNH